MIIHLPVEPSSTMESADAVYRSAAESCSAMKAAAHRGASVKRGHGVVVETASNRHWTCPVKCMHDAARHNDRSAIDDQR